MSNAQKVLEQRISAAVGFLAKTIDNTEGTKDEHWTVADVTRLCMTAIELADPTAVLSTTRDVMSDATVTFSTMPDRPVLGQWWVEKGLIHQWTVGGVKTALVTDVDEVTLWNDGLG